MEAVIVILVVVLFLLAIAYFAWRPSNSPASRLTGNGDSGAEVLSVALLGGGSDCSSHGHGTHSHHGDSGGHQSGCGSGHVDSGHFDGGHFDGGVHH